MSVPRVAFLRSPVRHTTRCLGRTQRRWATVHDVRFLATHHQGASIAEKYQEKLHQKAKAEGYRDVNELKASYQEKIEAQRQKAPLNQPSAASTPSPESSDTSSESSSPYSAPPPPPRPASENSPNPSPTSKPTTPPGIKTLSSFIDIEKTSALPFKEIESLWRLRHANDAQSLCATMPTSTYTRIAATARKHPQFILPLPREEKGAEIHFLQWTWPTPTTATVLFTHLAEFKLRGEYAQPHTTVTHHLDMSEGNGVVLLQGAVVKGKGVSVEEGRWLIMCLQKFYGGEVEQDSKQRLLEMFSGGDKGFKVEDLLEEAEKIV